MSTKLSALLTCAEGLITPTIKPGHDNNYTHTQKKSVHGLKFKDVSC